MSKLLEHLINSDERFTTIGKGGVNVNYNVYYSDSEPQPIYAVTYYQGGTEIQKTLGKLYAVHVSQGKLSFRFCDDLPKSKASKLRRATVSAAGGGEAIKAPRRPSAEKKTRKAHPKQIHTLREQTSAEKLQLEEQIRVEEEEIQRQAATAASNINTKIMANNNKYELVFDSYIEEVYTETGKTVNYRIQSSTGTLRMIDNPREEVKRQLTLENNILARFIEPEDVSIIDGAKLGGGKIRKTKNKKNNKKRNHKKTGRARYCTKN